VLSVQGKLNQEMSKNERSLFAFGVFLVEVGEKVKDVLSARATDRSSCRMSHRISGGLGVDRCRSGSVHLG
jgi:hypothetical protein